MLLLFASLPGLALDPVLQLSAVYLNALLRSRKTSYLTAEMIDQLLKGFI